MELSEQIKLARERKGLTIEDVAASMGVTKSAVVWWETPIDQGGSSPRSSRLEKLQKVLGTRFVIGDPSKADVTANVRADDVRLAIAISRLPKPQRQAIVALVGMVSKPASRKSRIPGRAAFYDGVDGSGGEEERATVGSKRRKVEVVKTSSGEESSGKDRSGVGPKQALGRA